MRPITFKEFSLWSGHAVASLAILYGLLFESAGWTAWIALLQGGAYFLLALKVGRPDYLYPAGILISLSYWKALRAVLIPPDLFLPFFLPLTFLFLFLGFLFRQREERGKRFSGAMEITGHLAPLWMGGMEVVWPGTISRPLLSGVVLGAFCLFDLWLVRRHREKWFFLPASLFLFLSGHHFLHLLPLSEAQRGFYLPLLIPAVLFWGVWLQKRKGLDDVKPIYAGSVLISLFLTILIFTEKDAAPDLMIALVSAFVYTFLMILYRQDGFGYLILFSLGGFAFGQLLKGGDHFYRQYYDFFFYGLLFIGLLLLYPLLKQWFGLNPGWASYLGKSWLRLCWVFLPLSAVALALIFSYGTMYIENPNFCGSCHNMVPYYETWKKDAHVRENAPGRPGNPAALVSALAREETTRRPASEVKPVGCLACHYPPGIQPWLKMKSIGYMELVTFFLGDLSTKPQGQVWDEACLECHVKEKLYRNTVFRKQSRFNHDLMISQRVRGIDLRCTTCHSSTGAEVSGGKKHFDVDPSICYLCHLAAQKEEAGVQVGTCYTCHEPSIDLDPAVYRDLGTVRVAPEKCLGCHPKIEKLEDTQYQHDVHINRFKTLSVAKMNTRKVGCLDCHEAVRHGNFGRK